MKQLLAVVLITLGFISAQAEEAKAKLITVKAK